MNAPAFVWMESWMDGVLIWLMMFLPIIIAKIIILRRKGIRKSQDSMYFTEAIGLPLTFGQPVVFAYALYLLDIPSLLLTFWWGPCFLAIVVAVLWSKKVGHAINWQPYAGIISWLCKLVYCAYLLAAWYWQMPKLAFALSAWIASDQIEKSFASLDADRTRRSFHDFWLIRLAYPLLLLLPFYANLSLVYQIYGVILLALWLAGLIYVWRQKEFMNLPEDPTLLRNMRYFKRLKP
jgi:hypothetical protein